MERTDGDHPPRRGRSAKSDPHRHRREKSRMSEEGTPRPWGARRRSGTRVAGASPPEARRILAKALLRAKAASATPSALFGSPAFPDAEPPDPNVETGRERHEPPLPNAVTYRPPPVGFVRNAPIIPADDPRLGINRCLSPLSRRPAAQGTRTPRLIGPVGASIGKDGTGRRGSRRQPARPSRERRPYERRAGHENLSCSWFLRLSRNRE